MDYIPTTQFLNGIPRNSKLKSLLTLYAQEFKNNALTDKIKAYDSRPTNNMTMFIYQEVLSFDETLILTFIYFHIDIEKFTKNNESEVGKFHLAGELVLPILSRVTYME